MMRGRATTGSIGQEIAALPDLPRAVLVDCWTRAYGHPPPKGLSRRLLEYAAAYHLQMQAFGGLKPAVRRKLHRSTTSGREGAASATQVGTSKNLPPGSRLVRQWRGRIHTVDVLDAGFRYDGDHYGSLSEVARAITGARWSGPRFFGL